MRTSFAAVLLFLSIAVGGVQAQPVTPYVFASAGLTYSSASCDSLADGWCAPGDVEANPGNWRVGVGVEYGWFGIEFAYSALGTYISWTEPRADFPVQATQSTRAYFVTPTLQWSHGRLGLIARFGAAFWQSDASLGRVGFAAGQQSVRTFGTSPTVGLGLKWSVSDRWSFFASVDWIGSTGTATALLSRSSGAALQSARVDLWTPSVGVRASF